MKTLRKKIVIVGAGVTGLAIAYKLSQYPYYDVTLIEKASRVGGWVQSRVTDEGIFETGPKGVRIRGKAGKCFLNWVRELGLEDELIVNDPSALSRSIWLEESLQRVTEKPWLWHRSKATKGLAFALIKELFRPFKIKTDITIKQFFCDRFGPELYQQLIDPALLGVFGVSGEHLSMQSCFPDLWYLCQKHKGLMRAMIFRLFHSFKNKVMFCKNNKDQINPWPLKVTSAALCSFRYGMAQFIEALQKNVADKLMLEQGIEEITYDPTSCSFKLNLSYGELDADHLFITCAPWSIDSAIKKLLRNWPYFKEKVGSTSLALVQLCYNRTIDKQLGFGYLVPSQRQAAILGTVFDSNIFSEHNRSNKTRVTVMLPWKLEKEDGISLKNQIHLARMTLEKQLHWHEKIHFQTVHLAFKALPVYHVHHLDRLKVLEKEIEDRQLGLHFCGLGYRGFAFSQCLLQATELADNFMKEDRGNFST
jgi:oxygen-dependent protoporphyrinogen oxidase